MQLLTNIVGIRVERRCLWGGVPWRVLTEFVGAILKMRKKREHYSTVRGMIKYYSNWKTGR